MVAAPRIYNIRAPGTNGRARRVDYWPDTTAESNSPRTVSGTGFYLGGFFVRPRAFASSSSSAIALRPSALLYTSPRRFGGFVESRKKKKQFFVKQKPRARARSLGESTHSHERETLDSNSARPAKRYFTSTIIIYASGARAGTRTAARLLVEARIGDFCCASGVYAALGEIYQSRRNFGANLSDRKHR